MTSLDFLVGAAGLGDAQGQLLPFIISAITTPSDVSTCRSAITCFSDLLLIIGDTVTDPVQKQNCLSQIIHYRDRLMSSIFESLRSSDVPRDIKPDLFTCISCMFWELSDYCLVLVPACIQVSMGAAAYPVEELVSDDDWEWADRLFCSVVELWDSLYNAVPRNDPPIRESFSDMLQLIKSTVLMIRDLAVSLGPESCSMVGMWGVRKE